VGPALPLIYANFPISVRVIQDDNENLRFPRGMSSDTPSWLSVPMLVGELSVTFLVTPHTLFGGLASNARPHGRRIEKLNANF